MVLETDGTGATQASYVLGGSELLSQKRGSTSSYYLKDGQGSVRTLLDGLGAATDRYSYDAFGAVQNRTGTTANNYQYTGQQYDVLSGLYDLRARYYNPSDGRFLSQDTASVDFNNPIELNRYVYTANNSVNYIDPTGNDYALSLTPARSFTLSGSALKTLGFFTLGLLVTLIAAAVLLPRAKELYNVASDAVKQAGLNTITNWFRFTVVIAEPTTKLGSKLTVIAISNYFSRGFDQIYQLIKKTLEPFGSIIGASGVYQDPADHAERLMVNFLRAFKAVWYAPQIIPGAVSNPQGICASCAASALATGGNLAAYTIDDTKDKEIYLNLYAEKIGKGSVDPNKVF